MTKFCVGFVGLPVDSQGQQQLPQQAYSAVVPPADRPRLSDWCHPHHHAPGDGTGQDEKRLY